MSEQRFFCNNPECPQHECVKVAIATMPEQVALRCACQYVPTKARQDIAEIWICMSCNKAIEAQIVPEQITLHCYHCQSALTNGIGQKAKEINQEEAIGLWRCPACDYWVNLDNQKPLKIFCNVCGKMMSPDMPKEIGRYEIQSKLGEGGMGMVYLAQDPQLKRPVAIKLMSGFQSMQAEYAKRMQRFEQEAKVIAALHQHPNIITIYEFISDPNLTNTPYLVMEYIEGHTLEAWVTNEFKRNTLDMKKIAEMIEKCAKALQIVHDKGIIHRDIKPSNIMITANAQEPKVMDFGVAKIMHKTQSFTEPDISPGTPEYMAPEQFMAMHNIDARSDVFGLGATLYYAITGTAPFPKVRTLSKKDPERPTKRNPAIPKDLEAIVCKCLEFLPNHRYSSMNAFADDLRRFQEERPVQAKTITLWTQARKWIIRNRALSLSLGTILLLIITSLTLITWQWLQVEQEKKRRGIVEEANVIIAEQRKQAEQALVESRHYLGIALLERAKRYQTEGMNFEAKMIVGRALGFIDFGGPVPEYRPLLKPDSKEWEEAQTMMRSGLDICPVWKSPCQKISGLDSLECAIYSPDGKHIAAAGNDKTIYIWDVATGQQASSLHGHKDFINSLAYSPDGKYIAAAGRLDNSIRIWDVATGQQVFLFTGHKYSFNTLVYSPDGKYLASDAADNTIKIWDIATGAQFSFSQGHTGIIASLAYSPDGNYIASGSFDRTIRIWDITTKKQIALFQAEAKIRTVAYSPDGKYLAGGFDKTIKIWDIATKKQIALLQGHTNIINSVAYSRDGKYIASGSFDKTIRIWNAGTKQQIALIPQEDSVLSVAYSPDGKRMASGCINTIRIWDISTGQQISLLQGHTSYVYSVAYSPDGKYLASGGMDHTIRIWDIFTGQQVSLLQGHTSEIHSVTYSPDGNYIASSSADHSIRIWSVSTGQQVSMFQGHTSWVFSIAYSPDGDYLASGSMDNSLRIWNVSTGQQVSMFQGHTSWVFSIAYSPDGKYLASGSMDNSVRIWNVSTGQQVSLLQGHTSSVQTVAYSPDGNYIASGSTDHSIRIWDVSTGQQVSLLDGQINWGNTVAYSPDGNLASSSNHGIRLWKLKLFSYTQYLPFIQYSKVGLGVEWNTKLDLSAGYYLPGPSNGSFAILRSSKSEAQKNQMLFYLYLNAGNFSSAILLAQQCLNADFSRQVHADLLQALLQSAAVFAAEQNDAMAQYRLDQFQSMGGNFQNLVAEDDGLWRLNQMILMYPSCIRQNKFTRALALVQEPTIWQHHPTRYALVLANQKRLNQQQALQTTMIELAYEPGYIKELIHLAYPSKSAETIESFKWKILAYYQDQLTEGQLFSFALQHKTRLCNMYYFFVGLWHISTYPAQAKDYLNQACLVPQKWLYLPYDYTSFAKAELQWLK